MDNTHDQPLPPGVQSLPNYSTNPAPSSPKKKLTQLLTRPLNILITPQDLSITLATREIMSFRFLILIQPLILPLIAHIRIMVHQMVMLLNGQVTSQITFIMAMLLNWVQYNIMVPTTRFLRIS